MDKLYIYSAFRRNEDGSWTCTAPVTINHPRGRIQVAAGKTVNRGELFMGVWLADWLEQNRPAAYAGASESVGDTLTAPPARPGPRRVRDPRGG